MRRAFAEHLNELKQDLFTTGEMVTIVIKPSIKARWERNVEEAKRINNDDTYINETR